MDRLTLVALSLATTLAATSASAQDARYDAARDQYEVGHFEPAFSAFAALADEGHCAASRMAQQMVRYGKTLYAAEFKVPRERLERWQRLPDCPVALAAR